MSDGRPPENMADRPGLRMWRRIGFGNGEGQRGRSADQQEHDPQQRGHLKHVEKIANRHHGGHVSDGSPQPDAAVVARPLSQPEQRRRIDQRYRRAQKEARRERHGANPDEARAGEHPDPAHESGEGRRANDAHGPPARVRQPAPEVRRRHPCHCRQGHHGPDLDWREADRLEVNAEEGRERAEVCEIEEIKAGKAPAGQIGHCLDR